MLSVYGKTPENIKHRPINRLEPASREKGQLPISNGLHLKDIFERDGCASGWLDIWVTLPCRQLKLTLSYTNSQVVTLLKLIELKVK